MNMVLMYAYFLVFGIVHGLFIPRNKNTTKFAVDGASLPNIDFDIGKSYAGRLPVSDKPNEKRKLWFWFFPSENHAAKDGILIWLNGGPGCASTEGFLQEIGPVSWQFGTFKPVKNPWTWVKLTNVVFVDQPLGTGYSRGEATETNEVQTAKEFVGFWKHFVDQFGLHGKKVYIAGESYGGYYVPYIADAMLNSEDETYYDLTGTLMYDPQVSYNVVGQQMFALPFAQYHSNLFPFNVTFLADVIKRDQDCGYAAYRLQYTNYPPLGPLPSPPQFRHPSTYCHLWGAILEAILEINPCFSVFEVSTTCPLLYDPLGVPGTFRYHRSGWPKTYFNQTAVQKALHAPIGKWVECAGPPLSTDTSPPSALSVLPGVIERSQRSLIVYGRLDYELLANGTLMAIQNMTWNGKQGFQLKPYKPFYVPAHRKGPKGSLAGQGTFGITHEERGLTWVEQLLAGHMGPQFAPSAAYRQLEYLLGRIPNLRSKVPFTTDPYGEESLLDPE